MEVWKLDLVTMDAGLTQQITRLSKVVNHQLGRGLQIVDCNGNSARAEFLLNDDADFIPLASGKPAPNSRHVD